MTNEVEVVNTVTGEVIESPKKFNRKIAENVIRISIKCKKMKTSDGKPFNSVKALKYIPYFKDGKNLGNKNCWLDLHFLRTAFKGVPAECDVHSPEDLVTGYLYVQAKYIQSPNAYKVIEEVDNEGKITKKYPEVWVKGGIVGFEPYVASQDSFEYHQPIQEGEVVEDDEDGSLTEDTDDTEETNI